MADSPILDHRGRPFRKGRGRGPSAGYLDKLIELGIEDRGDSLVIPKDVVRELRRDRLRRDTVTKVPHTPRHMMRDANGVGVRKGHGRYDVLSLHGLRAIKRHSPILQPIHEARRAQYEAMSVPWSGRKGDVGWRVVHRDHNRDREVPEYIKPYIQRFERMLERPHETRCKTTSSLICRLGEDLLTINRPTIELSRSVWDENVIVGFAPVDGAIIWPTLAWVEKWMGENPGWNHGRTDLTDDEAYELLSEAMEHNIREAEYCLVRDGILEAVYSNHDLILSPRENTTDIEFAGYPPSQVEKSIEAVASFGNAFDYNATFFTRGMVVDRAIGVSADVHDDAIAAFIDQLREAGQGVEMAHRVPVIALPMDGALQVIDLKSNNRDMLWEEYMALLTSLATAVYRMDPSEINAKPWGAGGGPSLSEGNRSAEIQYAKAEGLKSDLTHIAHMLTEVARVCHPDLRVIFELGGEDVRHIAEVQEIRARVKNTRNEMRIEDGESPIGFYAAAEDVDELSDEDREKYDTNPWNWPTDQGFAQAMQQQAMAAQQEEMGGMPGMPGAPGMEGDEPPPDDGFGQPQTEEDDGFGEPPPSHPYGQPDEMQKGRSVTIYVEHWPASRAGRTS